MKYIAFALLLGAVFTSEAASQITVKMSVNTAIRTPISPYIYGSNGQSDDRDERVTARRIGGNRLTGYNWENNASNAGNDWQHSSDNYLPWLAGIADDQSEVPGIVLTAFHDTSLAMGAYSLITLPMAGYVAADKNGDVFETETAPSLRWARIVNRKNAELSTTPNVHDSTVYTDELLHFLTTRYGTAQAATGIRAYSMDNEPALWTYTHPRIVPEAMTVKNLIAKSIDMARTIKTMDPDAEVFGPALYGFNAYRTLQDAPDWNEYAASYKWFVDVYLDSMRHASEQAGTRLIDVFDIHWYPEPAGVYSGDISQDAAIRRMQAPRSLWDSSYVEESWIGQWFSPVAMLHKLQHSAEVYYPGTKLAVTEYDYGAAHHISGGIAQADALGIFGRMGVYFASHWGALDDYISSAYRLFRNYDGNGSAFGSMAVRTETTNNEATSVYASVQGDSSLHIILLNKDYSQTVTAMVDIDGGQYGAPSLWKFDQAGPEITQEEFSGTLQAGTLSVQLAPLSAYHLVLPTVQTTSVEELRTPIELIAANDNGALLVRYAIPLEAVLTVTDIAGRTVYTQTLAAPRGRCSISLSSGAYMVGLSCGIAAQSRKVVILR